MKTSPAANSALALLAAVSASNNLCRGVEAFAPHHSFHSSHVASKISSPLASPAPPNAASRHSTSNAARPAQGMVLQANLFDRFFRVARGNLNSALSQFEDPEKVMDQALIDMQNDIVKIRQTYAEVTAGQRRLVSQKNQDEAVADDWYRRAQLALKRSNEGLAREALARREQALQKATAVHQQLDTQATSLEKLYEGMKAVEGKILEANAKKSELAARAKTAKSTAWVNDMLSGLSGRTSMDAFRRMEDKVASLETQAEVSTEMLNNSLLAPSSADSSSKMDIELEFRRLEASDTVDKEFEMLKKAMLPAAKDESAEAVVVRIPVTRTR
jgi:phage shock protein A